MDQKYPLLKTLLARVVHWGPLSSMLITCSITYSSILLSDSWLTKHNTSFVGVAAIWIFVLTICCTLYNLFCAMLIGPGLLPLGWDPNEKQQPLLDQCGGLVLPNAGSFESSTRLRFCGPCQGYKAPRAHHCRRCNRCVVRMDHHCPWINNCIGQLNQRYFIRFLSSAILTAVQSTVYLSCGLYRAFYIRYYFERGDPLSTLVYLPTTMFIFVIFNVGLSVGVVVALSGLLYYQLKGIRNDSTMVEDTIAQSKRQSTKAL